MSEFKNDEGRPLGVRPTHLYCKPSQRAAAMDIVKEFGNSGESNVNRNLVKVVDTPWLA
jgi:phage major head subunit gpT-like protein